ncbi:ATP-binding protein [Streptomyces sp. NPDC048664]|uniref:ATP-binding protein n=1 Tax=Streptomyces sp. NPDC048664 TaxID=3154505 RepID=UPI00341658F0
MSIAQLSAAPREDVAHVFPLPHAARAVPTVRRRAERVVAHWNLPPEVAEDVLLVVSELLTNAVVHALPPAALRLTRVRVRGRAAVRVEVTDLGPVTPAAASAPDASIDPDEHGRGLCIVRALADRYGVEVHPGGTCRWAELALE